VVDRSGVSGRPRSTRLLVPGVTMLLVLVAIAASGSTPSGSGGSRTPSQWFLDVFASVVLVVVALGTVLLVVLVILRPQEVIDQMTARERRRGRTTVTIGLVVVALLVAFAIRRFATGGHSSGGGLDASGVTDAAAAIGNSRYEPQFATSAVLVVLAVVAMIVIAAVLVVRNRRSHELGDGDAQLAEELATVLDETLDDIREERDARRAVIAAYARLEQVFAAHGVPREPTEAPDEYLTRVLASLDVPRRAATRLTELFAAARFSDHVIPHDMKDEAIDALVEARNALRLAAERSRVEREHALSAARERAAT
jgi:Domain of unknown function (DUF4129)